MQKILLIAFKFPPFSGVGAFRWTKLSKHLAKLGHEVHVLTVPWTAFGSNSLINDVKHPNIIIHRIRSGYLHNFRYRDLGHILLNWLKIKILLFFDQLFYWDDEAQHWGRYLLPEAKKLIKENNINIVVATGAPFEANYWAAMLKKDMKDIFLIQDFRDPWVQNPFKKYSLNRKKKAYQRMLLSMQFSDLSITVTPGLLAEYKKVCPDCDIRLITNGYDPDVISPMVMPTANRDKKVFVHIGNISNGRDIACKKFLDAVQNMSDISIQVQLIGHVPPVFKLQYQEMVKQGKLVFIGTVSQEMALHYVAQGAVALHFGAKEFPYALSTKLFEYAGLKKPVLSVNFGGDIEQVISECQLGKSVNLNNTTHVKQAIIDVLKINVIGEEATEKFSHAYLAQKFIKMIEGLESK